MSKVQFEALDIGVFAVIGVIGECISTWAFIKSGAYISISVFLGLVCMVRWGWAGIFVPLLSGVAAILYRWYSGNGLYLNFSLENTIGYLPLLLNLLWFRNNGKERTHKMWGSMMLYVLTGFAEITLGKSLCYIGVLNVFSALGNFFLYDLLNLGIAFVLYFIACRQKNLVTDMTEYIINLQTENQTAAIREEIKDYKSLEELAEKDEVSDIALLDGGMVTAEQLENQQKVYRQMEGEPSKFDEENKAFEQKPNSTKKSGGK